jgi:3-isopropylmalate dehydrogenase
MQEHKLLLLPGDGIGVEAMAEAKKLIACVNETGVARFETEEDLVGGASIDAHGVPITESAMNKALAADAVLFGAVGGPRWEKVD